MANTTIAALNPRIPLDLQSRLLFLPDKSRNMGIHLVASKGTGKSRLMGRVIAWQDFVRGIPLVVFDPHGPTIDNFIDKITRLPADVQKRLWPRILYVNMSGAANSVITFPLYYRLGAESLYAISQRYLDVVRRLDPYLQTASIEGWNALWRIGTNVGMILAACGLQITEAEEFLNDPKQWATRLAQACQNYPEAEPAAAYFTKEFARLNPQDQSRRAESFLNKTAIFRLDPTMKAMFGANTAGINWQDVVDHSLAILVDFRGEHDLERMRFKLVWSFNSLLEFIKHRGAGRHKPLSLIIDEITYMLSSASLHSDILAADMDELINRLARNYMIWLTLCHQEMYQLSEPIQKTLLTMGTQIFGSTTDLQAAIEISRRFFRYNPAWVRKYQPVYDRGMVIDHTSQEFTMDEQAYLQSLRFIDLPRYHYLVAPSPMEGTMPTNLFPVSIAGIDPDMYVNEPLVAEARVTLMQMRGRQVTDIMAEIAARSLPQPAKITRFAALSTPPLAPDPKPARGRK